MDDRVEDLEDDWSFREDTSEFGSVSESTSGMEDDLIPVGFVQIQRWRKVRAASWLRSRSQKITFEREMAAPNLGWMDR